MTLFESAKFDVVSPFQYHRPYFQIVGPGAHNCDSMGVVMEMPNIPLGESSSQVQVLDQLK
jgi:hypothetical protein